MFPTNGECLIGISDAFFAFCLQVSVIFPTCSLYPQQKHAYSALHPQAWTYIQVHAHRHLLSAVPWISEDCLFVVVIASCFWWIFSKYLHGFSKFFSFVYCQLPGKNPVSYLWKDTVMTWGVVLKAFSTPAHTFFWSFSDRRLQWHQTVWNAPKTLS